MPLKKYFFFLWLEHPIKHKVSLASYVSESFYKVIMHCLLGLPVVCNRGVAKDTQGWTKALLKRVYHDLRWPSDRPLHGEKPKQQKRTELSPAPSWWAESGPTRAAPRTAGHLWGERRGDCRFPATQPGAAVHQGWERTASCRRGVVTLAWAALPSWAILAPSLRLEREPAQLYWNTHSFPLSHSLANKQANKRDDTVVHAVIRTFLSRGRAIVVLIYSRMLHLHLIFVWRGDILVPLCFSSS